MEAQAQRTARRFRTSARARGATGKAGCGCGHGPLTRQIGETLKGGNLFINRLEIPDSVAPGGRIEVRVEVSNGAVFITDEDHCDIGGNPGYQIEVVADPNWTAAERVRNCHDTTTFGTRDITYTLDFVAPQVSQQTTGTIDVTLRARQSGESVTISREIVIEPEAEFDPEPTPDEPAGDGNGNGDGDGPDLALVAVLGLLAFGGAIAVSQR